MATRQRRGTQFTSQIHMDRENQKTKGVKRQTGERSPQEKGPAKKTRTAFGDITNRDNAKIDGINKKVGQKKIVKPKKSGSTKQQQPELIAIPKPSSKLSSSQQGLSQQSNDMSWDIMELSPQESNSSSSQGSDISSSQSSLADSDVVMMNERNAQMSEQPHAWIDIDAEHMQDPYQCSLYAYHIFEYYKTREDKFRIPDYMTWQNDLSLNMRSILVDWLVEVQENFELNHETLYLAVKLVDHYLAKINTRKDRLQLVGATAMFIASKFDERLPPVLDDFLYICDDAYKREELIAMEMSILKAIDFDLGIPLSYRYLRRYAKCARVDMETLTLGRYILEMSLMDYEFSRMSDAKLAASALRLAMRMKKNDTWDATTEHYTACTVADVEETMLKLNTMISGEGSKQLTTIRTKYSHKVFHEVAKIPALSLNL